MTPIDTALAWLAAHPVLSTLIVVPLVTYLGNLLIAWLSGPRWLTLLTKYPRLAAVMKVAQALGVDPVRLARWALTVLTGKLPQPVKLPAGKYMVSETIEVDKLFPPSKKGDQS